MSRVMEAWQRPRPIRIAGALSGSLDVTLLQYNMISPTPNADHRNRLRNVCPRVGWPAHLFVDR